MHARWDSQAPKLASPNSWLWNLATHRVLLPFWSNLLPCLQGLERTPDPTWLSSLMPGLKKLHHLLPQQDATTGCPCYSCAHRAEKIKLTEILDLVFTEPPSLGTIRGIFLTTKPASSDVMSRAANPPKNSQAAQKSLWRAIKALATWLWQAIDCASCSVSTATYHSCMACHATTLR